MDFGRAEKLINISLGVRDNSKPKMVFNSESFSKCTMLEELDITNCVAPVEEGEEEKLFSLNLEENIGFKKLSAQGSSLGAVLFAPNGLLESVILNEKIESLSFVNCPNLVTISIPNNNNLQRLRFENCPKTNSYNLINSVKDQLTHLRLIGINWQTEVANVKITEDGHIFQKLGLLGGIDEKGSLFVRDNEEHKGSVL